MSTGNLERYSINQEAATQAANDLRTGAQNVLDKLEEIKLEMSKIDNQDEAVYFNSDENRKPGAFKAELDANAVRFNQFKEQIDAFATFVEGQVADTDNM